MFEQQALQEYILLCCQNPTGGLLDKPGKSVPHHLDTHTHTHVHHPHISRLEHSTHNQVWFTLLYSCTWVSRVVCSCVQIQRFLPHVLLPERPLHRTALWERGPPPWDHPRQGGEQIGEGKTAGLIKKWLTFWWGRIHLPLNPTTYVFLRESSKPLLFSGKTSITPTSVVVFVGKQRDDQFWRFDWCYSVCSSNVCLQVLESEKTKIQVYQINWAPF